MCNFNKNNIDPKIPLDLYGPNESPISTASDSWLNPVKNIFKRSRKEFITRDQFNEMIGAKVIE